MSVSYACNLLSISRLAGDTMLYRPIVVSLRLNDAGNRGDSDGAPTAAPADQLPGGRKYLNGNEAERASRRF